MEETIEEIREKEGDEIADKIDGLPKRLRAFVEDELHRHYQNIPFGKKDQYSHPYQELENMQRIASAAKTSEPEAHRIARYFAEGLE